MDDNDTMIEDALTKARRERRRLLIGGGVTGSLMLTLPSRRLLANTPTKKYHGSLWCSFCNAKKVGGAMSHTPITTNQCGDLPSTWYNYLNSSNPNDGPAGWQSWDFESKFHRPSGYSLLVNGQSAGSASFRQCIQGVVTYKKGSTIINSNYAKQACSSYLNAKYYYCTQSFYRAGGTEGDVCAYYNQHSSDTWKNSCTSKYSGYNLD